MLFNSLAFLLFFPTVVLIYFLLPHKFRWVWLLASSCFFYMSFVAVYIFILLFTIIVDYYAGILIEKSTGTKRKYYLLLSLIANIGVLCIFKYYNFFVENISDFFALFHIKANIPLLTILLPIGLSFHTFQAMSYTLEVYYGNQKAERHFGIYALYVMFFPQLVAGPIERPQNLIHQFYEKHSFSYDNAVIGLNLIVIGLFKKVVVADRLGTYVDKVYDDVDNADPHITLIALLFYSVQIFADFSGYSDIARGTAKFMGFDLMINFDKPFFSKNNTEFWRRWHISLSTWIKDYLFAPISVDKRNWGKWGIVYALMISFVISGVWHGAGWNFVIFGTLHGAVVTFEFLTKKFRKNLSKITPVFLYNGGSIVMTFLLESFIWIFFRSPTFETAIKVIRKIGEFNLHINMLQIVGEYGEFNFIASVFFIILLIFSIKIPPKPLFRFNFLFLSIVTLIILILGANGTNRFIYFQF